MPSKTAAVLLVLGFVICLVLIVRTTIVHRSTPAAEVVEAKVAREALLAALQIAQAQYAALIRENERLRAQTEVWRDRALRSGYRE